MEIDRLSHIVREVNKWREIDPLLQNKRGFLLNYYNGDYQKHSVKHNKVWSKLFEEAMRGRITVTEIVFERMKEMQLLSLEESLDEKRKYYGADLVKDRDRVKMLRQYYENKYREILKKQQ